MTRKLLAGALAVLAAAGAGVARADPAPPPAAQPNDLLQAIEDGQPILDVRSRYEQAAQANLAPLAQSFTTRAQVGWQTAPFDGFQALVELAGAFHADQGHYNVAVPGGASLNGRTRFPIINDPSFATLNRAQIAWTPSSHVTVTVGRQRVLIDDQRFVGNSAWRQDEVRFDAARADFHAGKLSATYVYIWRVDRIFGGQLDWSSDSHLVNVAYDVAPQLRLQGFAYALDFSNATPTRLANAADNGGLTRGARLSGKQGLGPVKLAYDATWARETDYRGQTAPYALDFWQAEATGQYGVAAARIDYEQLDGNGRQGFITPLGTTHAFQGWADAFAADGGNKTFVDGIQDVNVSLAVSPHWKLPLLSSPQAIVRYYDFHAQLTGAYIANEWDAQIQAQLSKRLTAQITYADFERARSVPAGTAAPPPSRTKVWLSLEYRL